MRRFPLTGGDYGRPCLAEFQGATVAVFPGFMAKLQGVRNLEEGLSELQKKVKDLELRTCCRLGCHDVRSSLPVWGLFGVQKVQSHVPMIEL